MRRVGFNVGEGPGVNLARQLRGGRTSEYAGEDPLLAGNIAAEIIKGAQAQHIAATIKHFAFNDQETTRQYNSGPGYGVSAPERVKRQLDLLAFEIAIKEAQPGFVMCAYNKTDRILLNSAGNDVAQDADPACQSNYLLTTLLRNEWGFQGAVHSDWGANYNSLASALAGMDQTIGGGSFTSLSIAQNGQTATSSQLPQWRLDQMTHRVLRTLLRLGLFAFPPDNSLNIDQTSGKALAQSIAEQSIVLLKNVPARSGSTPVLPLSANTTQHIVVIGGHADKGVLGAWGSPAVYPEEGMALTCSGSSLCGTWQNTPWYKSPPLSAIRAIAPNADVTFLSGEDQAAATQAAAHADVAIIFAVQAQGEGYDLPDLLLPNNDDGMPNNLTTKANVNQNSLITAVAGSAPQTIVVLETGTAVLMPWIDQVQAVVEAWYPGHRGGQAIANVLFGKTNPSGKLPISFPKLATDLPTCVQTIPSVTINEDYCENLNMGYRWFDSQNKNPLFDFGFGLTYSSFDWSNFSANIEGEYLNVSTSLQNTSNVAGAEVAQVYVGLPASANDTTNGIAEPPKRLVGYQKVWLEPGQSTTVNISVPITRLKYWDDHSTVHQWRLADGNYNIFVGASSRDIKYQTTLSIDAPSEQQSVMNAW